MMMYTMMQTMTAGGDSDDGDLFGLPGHNCKKSEGVGYVCMYILD